MLYRQLFTACAVAFLTAGPSLGQNLLNEPEGTTYDVAGDRWLVSNWGDGNIVEIDSEGQQSYFSTYLTTAGGMHIVGANLYVASPLGATAGLIGFDLETGEVVLELPIPDMDILNDIASDTSGFLYVTDWRPDGRIIKVRLADYAYSVFVPSMGLPNGIVFDRLANRLLVCATEGGQARIKAVNLTDSTVTTVANTGVANCDGLTVDGNGHYYFTSWATGSVYQYDPQFLSRRVISSGHSGPASIFCDSLNNVLGIPCLNEHRVEFMSFPDSDGDGYLDINDNCPAQANPDQFDGDSDLIGDACDDCTDIDWDTFGDPGFANNVCAEDNCPSAYNPDQTDSDGDGLGDLCDGCTDTDGDGFGDPGYAQSTCVTDNCPDEYNPDQADQDQNGIGDVCDGCCVGRVGDANNIGGDEPTVGDVSVIIDAKFITGTCLGIIECLPEADINQSGGLDATCNDITIGDISTLIDYLFITGSSLGLADCP